MPAKRAYVADNNSGDDVLKISVQSGDLEKHRSVYFTDQSPTFTLQIKNIGDKRIEGSTYARLTFDESPDEYEQYTHQHFEAELDPGESTTAEYSTDMLTYQGNTALTVDRVSVTESDGVYEFSRYSGPRLERIYTFMVYDRDYYKVNYWRPRYAQYLASLLAVLIVFVGGIQILLTL